MDVEKSLWKERVKKDTSVKSLGSCYRVKREVCVKEEESIFIVKGRKRRSIGICRRPAEKRIYPTYYNLAKWLSHYLYLLYFTFSFELTTQEGVWESVTLQVSHSHSYIKKEITVLCHMMSHDRSHDECGKVVHRPCSSCISSV